MSQTKVVNLLRLDAETIKIGTEAEPSKGLGLLLCKE
jgi:hypothetical protein